MPRLEFHVLHFIENTRGQSGFSHTVTWTQDLALFETQMSGGSVVWARMCDSESDLASDPSPTTY